MNPLAIDNRFLDGRVKRLAFAAVSVCLIGVALAGSELHSFGAQFGRFPASTLVAVCAFLGLNLLIVWLRFWQMLTHLGHPLRAAVAWRVFLQGQLTSLFVIQLIGQTAGRALALIHHGVSTSTLSALVVYERSTLFLLSAALALTGACYLVGASELGRFVTQVRVPEILLVMLVAALLARVLGSSRTESTLLSRCGNWRAVGGLIFSSALTLLGQFAMLCAFVTAAVTLRPSIDLWQIFAASAVISFAASMPISINGWGVREVAAVLILEPLGFSRTEALAISILIGLLATLVMLAPMPMLLSNARGVFRASSAPINRGQSSDTLAAWVLGGLAAFLILFQFHARLPSGEFSVNFADALALLGLSAVLIEWVLHRRSLSWRIEGTTVYLASASAAMLLAFLIGIAEIGVTAWALSSRVLGWVILLGYFFLGAWFVQHSGRHGLRRLMDYVVACAVAIILVQLVLRAGARVGWEPFPLTANFEGYAANRNAFAFQMLACVAALLAWSGLRARHGGRLWHEIALGVVVTGIWLAQSRAALGALALLLVFSWSLRLADRQSVIRGLVVAACLAAVASTTPVVREAVSISPQLVHDYDSLRWASISEGLRLWRDSPLFGAGLGVFLQNSAILFPAPMVIHSTPVWWLAEFGLVGFAVFATGLLGVLRWGVRHLREADNAPARFVTLLCLIFAVVGLVHDIFAQRIFWFLLGAALVSPRGARVSAKVGRQAF